MLARPHQEPRGAKLSKIRTLAEVLRIMAVVEGFEPSGGFPRRWFSRPVHSAALPNHQAKC